MLYTHIQLSESKWNFYINLKSKKFVGNNATSFSEIKGNLHEITCTSLYSCFPEYVKVGQISYQNIYKLKCNLYFEKCNLYLTQIRVPNFDDIFYYSFIFTSLTIIFYIFMTQESSGFRYSETGWF